MKILQKPIVSICCITYNHEQYLEKTIYSILNQKVSQTIELVISNDASPDNSDEIIKNIIKKHKNDTIKIKYLKQKVNLGIKDNFIATVKECNGKYIALCEGDDYWIDDYKLQKQVDFLEKNKGYVFTCSAYQTLDSTSNETRDIVLDVETSSDNTSKGFDITFERTKKQWLTKTLTTLFLASALPIADLTKYTYTRDVHVFYYLMQRGKGYYMKEITGVYRKHSNGIHNGIDLQNRKHASYLIYKEIYSYHKKDEFVRKVYFNSLSYILIYFDEKFGDKQTLIKELLKISKGFTEYRIAISLLLKNRLKK